MSAAQAFGCVANTIRLRSGRYFDFLDPQPDQFTLGDIAGALSKICRFGGQVSRFYSVAEHCMQCAFVADCDGLPVDTQIACLMHDAAEAFTGDIVKPLKIMLPEFKEIEQRVEAVIAEKFCIDFHSNAALVREIDHAMLIHERRRLFSRDSVTWHGENEVRRLHTAVNGLEPEDAERLFVSRAAMLGISPIEG